MYIYIWIYLLVLLLMSDDFFHMHVVRTLVEHIYGIYSLTSISMLKFLFRQVFLARIFLGLPLPSERGMRI